MSEYRSYKPEGVPKKEFKDVPEIDKNPENEFQNREIIEFPSRVLEKVIKEVEVRIQSEHTPLIQLEKIRLQLETKDTIEFSADPNYEVTDMAQMLIDCVHPDNDIDLYKAA